MAIAFVGKTATQSSAGSAISFAADPSGADIMWLGISIRDTRSISVAPAFNGVTMTQSGSTSGTTGITNYLYYLANPFQGSANVTFTQSSSDNYTAKAAWFSGASSASVPDATSVGGPTTTSSYSQSVTSVADNCFAVLWADATSGSTLTGGSNTTVADQPELVFTGGFMAYSTAAKTPAGTFTLNVTSSSQAFAGCMASFAPSTFTRKALTLLGVS